MNANDTVVSGEGLFDLTTGENGKPPVITLSSGYTMPVLGLGTYSLHGDECIDAILSVRYCHILRKRGGSGRSDTPLWSAP